MSDKLQRVFHLFFALIAGAVLAGTVLRWQHNGPAAFLVALALAAALVFAARRLGPRADGLSAAQFRRLFWPPALALLCLLCVFGLLMDEIPIMDWAFVYESLPDFMENGLALNPNNNGYYIICNNNVGLALLLAAFYKPLYWLGIGPGTGAGYAAGILFNAVMLWLGILLGCRAARLALGRNSAPLLVLGMSLLFAPFYLWAPAFYSDTLCVPFLTGGICCYLAWRRSRHPAWMAGAGALAFLGYAVKGSLVVAAAAAALAALLEYGRSREGWLGAAAVLLSFGLLLGGYRLWQRQWLDWTDEEAICFPTELWFCYGSHDLGDYSQQDVDDCNALATLTQRRALMRARIAENYASRTAAGNLDFIYRKAVRTWGSGWYDADEFLAAQYHTNFTSRFIIPGQPGFMPLTYYCQVWQYLLLMLTAAGAALAVKDGGAPLLMPRLSLTGVVVFLSFWETKPRYAFHFSPVLILCAAAALPALAALGGPRTVQSAEAPARQKPKEPVNVS